MSRDFLSLKRIRENWGVGRSFGVSAELVSSGTATSPGGVRILLQMVGQVSRWPEILHQQLIELNSRLTPLAQRLPFTAQFNAGLKVLIDNKRHSVLQHSSQCNL